MSKGVRVPFAKEPSLIKTRRTFCSSKTASHSSIFFSRDSEWVARIEGSSYRGSSKGPHSSKLAECQRKTFTNKYVICLQIVCNRTPLFLFVLPRLGLFGSQRDPTLFVCICLISNCLGESKFQPQDVVPTRSLKPRPLQTIICMNLG